MSGILGEYNLASAPAGGTSASPFMAEKCQAPLFGQINTIKIRYYAITKVTNVKAGIYSDNAGTPGVFLGKSSSVLVTTGINTFTLISPVTVEKDSVYWIVFQADQANYGTISLIQNPATPISPCRYKATYTYDTWTDNPSGLSSSSIIMASYGLIESDEFSDGWDSNYENEVVTSTLNQQFIGMKFKCHSSADINLLQGYIRKSSTSGATECKIGLYNDNSGTIGTHIVHSGSIALIDDTVNFQEISSAVARYSLIKDNSYWIIIQANGNINYSYNVGKSYCPNDLALKTSYTYDTWTDNPSSITYGTLYSISRLSVKYTPPIQLTPSLEWVSIGTKTLNPALEWEVSKLLDLNASLDWMAILGHKFLPNIINYPFYFNQLSIQSSYATLGLSGCLAGYSIYIKNTGISGNTILGLYANNILQDTITIAATDTEYQTVKYFELNSMLNPKTLLELKVISVAEEAEDLKLELYLMTFPFELDKLFFGNLDNSIQVLGLNYNYFFNSADYWTIDFNQPITSINYVIGIDANGDEHPLSTTLIDGLFYNNRLKITPYTDVTLHTIKLKVLDFSGFYHIFEYNPIILEDYLEYKKYVSATTNEFNCFISTASYRYSFDEGTIWSNWESLINNKVSLDFEGQSAGNQNCLIQYKIGTNIIEDTVSFYYAIGDISSAISFYGKTANLDYSDTVPLDLIEIYLDNVLVDTKQISSITGFENLTINSTTGNAELDSGVLYYAGDVYEYDGTDIFLNDIDIDEYAGHINFLFIFGFNYLTKSFEHKILLIKNILNLAEIPTFKNFININAIYFHVNLLEYPVIAQQIVANGSALEDIFNGNTIDLDLKNDSDVTLRVIDKAGRELSFTNEYIQTQYNIWRKMNIYNPDTDEEILPGQIHQKETLTITLSTEDWGDNPTSPIP